MDLRRFSPTSSSPVNPAARSPSPPHSSSDPFRLQTRRLQLRNARFRGAHLSPQKTARLSSWGSLSSTGSNDKENQEENPENTENTEKSGSVRRRVSILQELHDSSSQRGRTKSRRSSVSHLFASALDHDDFSLPSTNTYHKSRNSSPASIFEDHDPGLYRDRGSPLSVTAKRKSRDAIAANYTADRYIEHLETQLAAVQSRLSPMQASTSQSQVSRLRSLSAEIKVLRQELAAWEDKFDARVGEEVSLRTELESKLRTKILFLEGQLEESAYRIKELECERDLQAQKLRNVESLRSTNRGLERRVDVLTELLAQSPTRREPQTPEFSPTRSPGPRLARPRSMLPSVPALTDVLYQPLVAPDGSQNVDADEPDTPDLIPDDSTMTSSSSVSKSQRSSTLSQISSISSQWSVPLPFSSELQGRTPSRPRNMRRFPSGTCTLKPLILPATTPTLEPARRESQQFDNPLMFSPTSDPDYSPGGLVTHGTCLAQEETLAALEGRTSYYQTFDEAMLSSNDDDFTMNAPLARARRSDSGASRYSRMSMSMSMSQNSRPCSSYSAMSNAVDDDFSPSHSRFSSQSRLSLTTTPVGRRRSRGCDRTPKAFDKTHHLSKVHEEEPARQNDTNVATLENVFCEVKAAFGVMAHRIVARVWHGSMIRAGKFSWWILSILLGPQRRDEWLQASSLRKRAREYDCQRQQQQQKPQLAVHSGNGIGHSLSLWAKFSVTLAVAVALAIRHGPGSLLDDPPANEHIDDNNNTKNNPKTNPEDTNPVHDTTITATPAHPVLWTRPLTIEDFLTG